MHLPRIRPVYALALAVAAAFIGALPARAQWSSLPNQNNPLVTGVTSGTGATVKLVSDDVGGFIAFWGDDRNNATSSMDLFAQRMDANGNRVWGNAGLTICNAIGDQPSNSGILFTVGRDGTGSTFVAWNDTRLPPHGGGDIRIYAQRITAAGQPQWAANGVKLPLVTEASSVVTSIGADGTGGGYFAYRQNITMYFQRLKSDGTTDTANGWTAGGITIPAVSGNFNSVEGIVKTTTDTGIAGTGDSVLAIINGSFSGTTAVRKVHRTGVLGWVANVPNFGVFGNGSELATWCPDGQDGALLVSRFGANLHVLRVKADGTFAWPTTNPAFISNSSGTSQSLVSDLAGGGYVFYRALVGSNYEARVQRFGPTGEAVWASPVTVGSGVVNISGMGTSFSAIPDGQGGVIVAWRQLLSGVPTTISQRINASGQTLWSAPGAVSNTVSADIFAPLQQVTDGNGGSFVVTAGSAIGDVQSRRVSLAGALGSNSPTARLANISARAAVGGSNGVLIPGFVVTGGTLQLLVRGIGPTLGTSFGVSGVLPDPQLSVVNAASVTIASNNDWSLAANAAEIATVAGQVGAFPLGASAKDAALLVTLQPGVYTAVMSSAVAAESGVGLVEMYEVGGASNVGRLVNMSVRAQVGTGDNILIPGIVVGGTGARSLLIRAVGPTLSLYGVDGVLANPQVTLYSGATVVGSNDNWSTPNGTQVSTIGGQVGAFGLPAGSLDAALLVTLAPGLYTAQVSGLNNTSGICLLEVYEVP